jgi:hypothetical protein
LPLLGRKPNTAFGPLWDHILVTSNITLASKEDAAMTKYIELDAHRKTCTAVVTGSKGKTLKKRV